MPVIVDIFFCSENVSSFSIYYVLFPIWPQSHGLKSFRTLLTHPYSVVSFQISFDHFTKKLKCKFQGADIEKEIFRTIIHFYKI